MSTQIESNESPIFAIIAIVVIVGVLIATFAVTKPAFDKQVWLANECSKYQDTVLAEMPAKCVKYYDH
jgi:hypothetical protein